MVSLFVIKGVILSALMPLFQNPDEQTHYGTIQYLAEPATKDWPILNTSRRMNSGTDITTYGFSEEVIQSARAAKFDEVKFEKQNIPNFSDPDAEDMVARNSWKHYIDAYPTSVSGTKSIYYSLASWLERFFSDESIFVRTFLMRLLAVAFGVGVIVLSYLIAKKIGLSEHLALLFMTLVAFQPMFSITAAQTNIDIALIFAFSLFLYTGVSFMKSSESHRPGIAWLGWTLLAILASILGLFSKGPGIALIIALYPLFLWGIYQKFPVLKRKFFVRATLATIALVGIAFVTIPRDYLASITNSATISKFHSPIESLGAYLSETIDQKDLRDTARSYWGNFGWLDSSIPGWTLSIIRAIEAIGFIGVLWYLLSPLLPVKWLPSQEKTAQPDWLPRRHFLIFFLGMILALQCAIRFYDWRVFDYTGQILIGQPGRYFLPNLIGHLMIIVVGLGFLVRQKHFFTMVTTALTLAMILLQIGTIINVIIPRYYL